MASGVWVAGYRWQPISSLSDRPERGRKLKIVRTTHRADKVLKFVLSALQRLQQDRTTRFNKGAQVIVSPHVNGGLEVGWAVKILDGFQPELPRVYIGDATGKLAITGPRWAMPDAPSAAGRRLYEPDRYRDAAACAFECLMYQYVTAQRARERSEAHA